MLIQAQETAYSNAYIHTPLVIACSLQILHFGYFYELAIVLVISCSSFGVMHTTHKIECPQKPLCLMLKLLLPTDGCDSLSSLRGIVVQVCV